MVAQFIHEVVDSRKDKKEGIITTAVLCGERRIKKFCYFFLLLSFLLSSYLLYLKTVNLLFVITTFFFSFFFTVDIARSKIDKKLRKRFRTLGVVVGFIYLFSLLL
jgi:4-hydroxybenzoate polyprenyltransferase